MSLRLSLPLDCPKCKKFAPAWMTTFADMSTLLMALFAILYSFAEQDEKSKALMLGSLNAQFGATVIVPTIDMPDSTKYHFFQILKVLTIKT